MREGEGGLFVVFEGIDGSGTTTQAERWASRLRAQKRAVHVTREPSNGPIGSLIRLVLTHRVSFAATNHPETMALLFAADRLDHVGSEVEPLLRDGWVVISDRYDLSSLAYQSVSADDAPLSSRKSLPPRDAEGSVAWIQTLNRHARRPDVTLVLDVSPDVADARRKARGGARELYEDRDMQARLARTYRDAERLVPGDRVVHIDGDQPADAVAEAIAAALEPFLMRK